MNKAVFLDRDGVINKEVNFLARKEDFEFLPNVDEAIAMINHAGFLVIVITNQPVVARNEIPEKELIQLHEEMLSNLKEKGAIIEKVYYCPHHPDKGFLGENKEYKIECECRKPKTGLFQLAKREFNIDMKQSYMVGDTTRDILAGKNAGCKTILVRTGYGGKDKKYEVLPDFVFDNLLDVANFITNTQRSKTS